MKTKKKCKIKISPKLVNFQEKKIYKIPSSIIIQNSFNSKPTSTLRVDIK